MKEKGEKEIAPAFTSKKDDAVTSELYCQECPHCKEGHKASAVAVGNNRWWFSCPSTSKGVILDQGGFHASEDDPSDIPVPEAVVIEDGFGDMLSGSIQEVDPETADVGELAGLIDPDESPESFDLVGQAIDRRDTLIREFKSMEEALEGHRKDIEKIQIKMAQANRELKFTDDVINQFSRIGDTQSWLRDTETKEADPPAPKTSFTS